jgi:Anti-sigma-K factor rskA
VSADTEARPPADDGFVERLTVHLDREAAGEAATGPVPVELRAFDAQLRAAATWSGPPAGLRDSVLAAVRAQAASASTTGASAASASTAGASTAGVQAAGVSAAGVQPAGPDAEPVRGGKDVTPARSRWGARWRARWGRLTWAVPAVALAVAVFTAGVVAVDRALTPAPPHGVTYVATGTQVLPAATGEVSVLDTGTGLSVVAKFHHLPPAAPGTYYAAWLRGPRGVVPLGSFHWHRGGNDVDMWSGVELADYPTFMVTLQREGDPPTPSTVVVMTGQLTGK